MSETAQERMVRKARGLPPRRAKPVKKAAPKRVVRSPDRREAEARRAHERALELAKASRPTPPAPQPIHIHLPEQNVNINEVPLQLVDD
jgi:hypothetical protein